MFLRNRKNQDFDIARIGWVSTSSDPESFLEPFLSKSPFIPTGWQQPKFDNLILMAQQMEHPFLRLQTLQEAEKILMTEMPIIPLYTIGSSRLLDPRLRVSIGENRALPWRTNHYSVMYLKYVYMK
jgi:oligopeptide transport system substrate-binding protein